MNKLNSIWVILDKYGNYCSFGSKVAWVSSGAAKNAFSCHVTEYTEEGYRVGVKLEDNPDYKLVEIEA